MEYAPSSDPDTLRLKTVEELAITLAGEQERILRKSHSLFGFHAASKGHKSLLSTEDLRLALQAATDKVPTDETLAQIMSYHGLEGGLLTFEDFRTLLISGELYPQYHGRYYVAISLAEAESIRRILHVRSKAGNSRLIPNASTEIALRYSPIATEGAPLAGDGGIALDASHTWRHGTGATPYEASVAHSSFRFFDGDMHYSAAGLNVLIRTLKGTTRERERFFLSATGVRRRMDRRWQEMPIAKVSLLTMYCYFSSTFPHLRLNYEVTDSNCTCFYS